MPEASNADYPRLVGDIGGTNARLALVTAPGEAPQHPRALSVSAFPGPAEAIEHYLAAENLKPRAAALAFANPITGDRVHMTNHDWSFSVVELRARLGLQRLMVLNDFTALALALPALQAADLEQVGGSAPRPAAPIGLIGPGTGLGVSGLLPSGDGWLPICGEGGHVTLCASDAREAALIAAMWKRHPHVSAERALSGGGLMSLYRAVIEVDGGTRQDYSAAQISQHAIDGSDPACVAAVETFCAMLGCAAGNLALTLGAHGGIYIGGGIVPKLGAHFARSPFRRRFEDKGRFCEYLAPIPAYVIHAPYPGLAGAAEALKVPPAKAGLLGAAIAVA